MPNVNSPLLLQSLLSDINGRRALALALRAQEGRGGEMVSGRYVPNMRAIGGPLARGLFGDPLQQLQGEEQGALASYGDELAGATEGLLGAEGLPDDAEFAKRVARAQTAGVPQDYVKGILDRRQSWQMLNQMLAGLEAPAPGVAAGGGGGGPPAGRGAAGGGMPLPPAGGAPAAPGAAPGGAPAFAGAMGAQGGGTPLASVPDGKLITMAAIMPDGPARSLAVAELKAREVKVDQGGLVTRGGRPIGMWKDGVFVDPQGRVEDVTGGALAARAGATKRAEAEAEFPFRTIETRDPSGRPVTTFASQLPGAPRPGGQQAPQAAPGGGRLRVNFEGTPDEVRSYVDRAIRENAAPTVPVAAGGALGVGPDPIEQKAREAGVETGARAQQGVNEDFIKSAYRPALDQGASASGTINQLDALERLALKTGWGSGVQAAAARILNGMGIAPDAAKQFAAKAETFYSIVGQQNWKLLAEQKGPQTEGDARRAAKVFAQLTNTEEANRFISDLARANALIAIEKAKFYRSALPEAQKAGDLSRIEAAWAERQPSVFSFPFMRNWGQAAEAATIPGAPAAGSSNPKVEQYLQQYGGP